MADDEGDDMGNRGGGGFGISMRQVPPAIVVTVTGTTSHERGRQLLSEALTAWLDENKDRNDRPYAIEPMDGKAGITTYQSGGNVNADRAASSRHAASSRRAGTSRSRR